MGPVTKVVKVYGGWVGRLYDRPGGELLHETTIAGTREAAFLFAWAWRYEYLEARTPCRP